MTRIAFEPNQTASETCTRCTLGSVVSSTTKARTDTPNDCVMRAWNGSSRYNVMNYRLYKRQHRHF